MDKTIFKDCAAYQDKDCYIIENSVIRRVLKLRKGLFRTESLFDKAKGIELASAGGETHDFSYDGLFTDLSGKTVKLEIISCSSSFIGEDIFTEDHVSLTITLHEPLQHITVKREYMIFPEIPAIAVKTFIASPVTPNFYARMNFKSYPVKDKFHENKTDSISIKGKLSRARCVSLYGVTDCTNNMVVEKDFQVKQDKELKLTGNILFAKRHGTFSGVFFAQEAPPADQKRYESDGDFILRQGSICSIGWGILPEEFKDEELSAYTSVLGIFHGDFDDAEVEFKRYFIRRFKDRVNNYRTMANPWGGGGAVWQESISNEFIEKEVSAAKEMGIELYQVDDGWQDNRNLSEMVSKNRPMCPADWAIRKDIFPNGFNEIKEACARNGVELCLWFAPSYNKSYRDWKEQAGLLYNFYSKFGIRIFKIDAIVINCRESEENLKKFFTYLRKRTGGEIYFNLDATSGRRPGYLMFQEFGNIFLENRYQNEPGLRRYEPWKTLRNLWRLSKYIPSQRMQIEFTDIDKAGKIKDNYLDTDYPENFTQEYVAAVSLFASPLCWAYPSKFTSAGRRSVRKIMDLHKSIRKELYDSVVIPIGEEPSGRSWTGFQAHNFNNKSGMIIVYREQADRKTKNFDLKYLLNERISFESIYGDEEEFTADFSSEKSIKCMLEKGNSFKIYKYSSVKSKT